MKRKMISLMLAMGFTLLSVCAFAPPASAAQDFFDDFESETVGAGPTRWDASRGNGATLTVQEEDGNKYLRISREAAVAENTGNKVPVIATKSGVVNLPLWNQTSEIVTEVKIRTSGVGFRKTVRLGYPENDADYNDNGLNKYAIFALRDPAAPAFYYLSGKWGSDTGEQTALTKYAEIDLNTWYTVKSVINPERKTIRFYLNGAEEPIAGSGGKTEFAITSEDFLNLAAITNITFKWIVQTGGQYPAETMDVDDVKLYYAGDEPEVLNFTDDLETETVGAAPSKWNADRNGVATVKVMEEGGNKFARIEKSEGKAGIPVVAMKNGMINLPMWQQGQNIVIEARIRSGTPEVYRSILRMGYPKEASGLYYDDVGQNRYALMYTHTSKSFHFLSGMSSANAPVHQALQGKTVQAGEWFRYKAVIDTDNKKISHYLDDMPVMMQQNFINDEFEAIQNLTNLTFTWREKATTLAGSMDFDDVKIYTESGFSAEVQYKDGVPLSQLTEGNITPTAYIKNDAAARTVQVVSALYEKDGSGLRLIEAQAQSAELTAYGIQRFTMQPFQVTDTENQVIRTFIWEQGEKPLTQPFNLDKTAGRDELFVSPDWDGAKKGTIEEPFTTLEEAKGAIRAMKENGSLPAGGVTVNLRGGDYFLEKPFILINENSGTQDSPITYTAYQNETPVMIGGVRIPEQSLSAVEEEAKARIIDSEARDKIKEIDLAALGITEIDEVNLPGAFSLPWIEKKPTAPELIINGRAMTLARYPNEGAEDNGLITIREVVDAGANPRYWEDDMINQPGYVPEGERDRSDTFVIRYEDDRISRWTQAEDARLYGYWWWNWADQTVPIKTINTVEKTIESEIPSWYSVREGQGYYAYNLLEEIDVPGEYYIDRTAKKLYFYPPDGEIKDMYLSLSAGDLIQVGADYINIRGITIPAARESAVAINADGVTLSGCEIANTGAAAVTVSGSDNLVQNCYFHDVNGGVRLYGGDRNTLAAGNNTVDGCRFERFSRLTKTYNGAVTLSGVGNWATNNKISDGPHLAVQLSGNDHLIAYNDISDVCQTADDMGAIYMGRSWTSRGNRICHNYIHDIRSVYVDPSAAWGVYGIFLDDQFSGVEISGNVFEEIQTDGNSAAVFIASGKDNKVINNAFIRTRPVRMNGASLGDGNIGRFAVTELSKVPYQSDIWKKVYPSLFAVLDGGEEEYRKPKGNEITRNVFYQTEDLRIEERVREYVLLDNNTPDELIGSDPGFADVSRGDYSIANAQGIEGFVPIDFSQMKK